jgi:hypothetical protein
MWSPERLRDRPGPLVVPERDLWRRILLCFFLLLAFEISLTEVGDGAQRANLIYPSVPVTNTAAYDFSENLPQKSVKQETSATFRYTVQWSNNVHR